MGDNPTGLIDQLLMLNPRYNAMRSGYSQIQHRKRLESRYDQLMREHEEQQAELGGISGLETGDPEAALAYKPEKPLKFPTSHQALGRIQEGAGKRIGQRETWKAIQPIKEPAKVDTAGLPYPAASTLAQGPQVGPPREVDAEMVQVPEMRGPKPITEGPFTGLETPRDHVLEPAGPLYPRRSPIETASLSARPPAEMGLAETVPGSAQYTPPSMRKPSFEEAYSKIPEPYGQYAAPFMLQKKNAGLLKEETSPQERRIADYQKRFDVLPPGDVDAQENLMRREFPDRVGPADMVTNRQNRATQQKITQATQVVDNDTRVQELMNSPYVSDEAKAAIDAAAAGAKETGNLAPYHTAVRAAASETNKNRNAAADRKLRERGLALAQQRFEEQKKVWAKAIENITSQITKRGQRSQVGKTKAAQVANYLKAQYQIVLRQLNDPATRAKGPDDYDKMLLEAKKAELEQEMQRWQDIMMQEAGGWGGEAPPTEPAAPQAAPPPGAPAPTAPPAGAAPRTWDDYKRGATQ